MSRSEKASIRESAFSKPICWVARFADFRIQMLTTGEDLHEVRGSGP